MQRSFGAVVLMVVGCLFPVWAGAEEPDPGWAEGPYGALLTDEERSEWLACDSAEARQSFVELFWARRDPDPGVPGNLVWEELERRVAVADQELAEDDLRGSLTDRGRVLLLLGLPAERNQSVMADYLARLYREPPARAGRGPRDRLDSAADRYVSVHGESFNVDRGRADAWEFPRADLGLELPDVPQRLETVTCVFFDRDGEGAFELNSRVLDAGWCAEAMAERVEQLVLHPDLEEVPGLAAVPGLAPASSMQESWRDASFAGAGNLALVAARGVAVPGRYPLWLVLSWPTDVTPRPDTMVGWLRAADGGDLGSFVRPLTGAEVDGSWEMSIPVGDVAASLELVLAADGVPLASRELDIASVPADASATFVSPVFTGVVTGQVEQYEAGVPFVFGGYHVQVRPDGAFAAGEDMAYFGLLANPGVDEDGAQLITVALELKSGARTVTSSLPEAVRLSQVAPGVYMFGKQLPLSAFPRGQRYRLRITVRDEIAEVTRATTVPIDLSDGV